MTKAQEGDEAVAQPPQPALHHSSSSAERQGDCDVGSPATTTLRTKSTTPTLLLETTSSSPHS